MTDAIVGVPSFSAYGRELDRHVIHKIKQERQRQRSQTGEGMPTLHHKSEMQQKKNNSIEQGSQKIAGTKQRASGSETDRSKRHSGGKPSFLDPLKQPQQSQRLGKARQGNFIFKCISRDQSPGFCHEFQREQSYEPKYKPQHEILQQRAPAYTIGAAVQSRLIDSLTHPPHESEYSTTYALCRKNPLLSGEVIANSVLHASVDQSVNDHNNHSPKHDGHFFLVGQKGSNEGHNAQNEQLEEGKIRKDVRLNLKLAGVIKSTGNSPLKSLRSTAVSTFNGGTQMHALKHTKIGNTAFSASGVAAATAIDSSSNTVPAALSARTTVKERRGARGVRSESQAGGSTLDTSRQQVVDWSALNDLELSQEGVLITQKTRDVWRNGWVQLDRQTSRDNLVPVNVSVREEHFQNYSANRPNPEKAHSFNSYTRRAEVFAPHVSPEYNLLAVNYDRLLPRNCRGDARFERYASWRNTLRENMDAQSMAKLEYVHKEENFDSQIARHVAILKLARLTARRESAQDFWPKANHGVLLHRTQQFERNLQLKGFKSYEQRTVHKSATTAAGELKLDAEILAVTQEQL